MPQDAPTVPAVTIPTVLIPKTGTSTSSFWVLIAAWLVGGFFTGLFTWLQNRGYLNQPSASALRGWLIDRIAELLPFAYLLIAGWLTKAYIQMRGAVSVKKAEMMGQYVAAQSNGAARTSEPDSSTTVTTITTTTESTKAQETGDPS
ncbi:MAG TPA: hypothetical protein VF723_11320 [Pyrinomonadaceae bacterium]|jgi:hypothetical protein